MYYILDVLCSHFPNWILIQIIHQYSICIKFVICNYIQFPLPVYLWFMFTLKIVFFFFENILNIFSWWFVLPKCNISPNYCNYLLLFCLRYSHFGSYITRISKILLLLYKLFYIPKQIYIGMFCFPVKKTKCTNYYTLCIVYKVKGIIDKRKKKYI